MKKFLFFAALMAVTMLVHARPVDLIHAQKAANMFLQNNAASKYMSANSASDVKLIHAELNSLNLSVPVYYVFSADNAFVIVAGDDRAQEILAYGNGPLDINHMPENMQFWLETYKGQLEYLQSHPDLAVEKPKRSTNRGVTVEPMIVTKWDQGYPYYNQCPTDGDRRSLTGCATTSLAQVFYKWQYPAMPTPAVPGYTTRTRKFELPTLPPITFDWANMLPVYNYAATDANKNAVAWLMRYIGQAEEMDYTNEGSEAWEDDIIRACHLFGYVNARVEYKATLDEYSHGENMIISDADWSVMIQDELIAGRPVVYCAYSYSNAYNMFYGHAFNVDGYDASTDMYSINWGWSGTGNGYFALRAFANQGYNYNLGELMVMGIEPPAPIEAYDPVMSPVDSTYITLTSFRAAWTDETSAENVTSYTLEVNPGDGSNHGVYEKVFTETFRQCTSTGSSAISNFNNYCDNSGWSGSNAYEANGGIRLGTSTKTGSITTPPLDMTQSGGKMTVVASIKPYSSDTNVPVKISCGASVVNLTITAAGTQTIVLDCDANESQKVTFATTEGGKRVIINQVDIYSSTNDGKMVFSVPAESGDSTMRVITDITDKYYTVQDLTAGGTFNYRVKAHYVNGTQSEWSNIEVVTLFDNGPAPHEYEKGDVNHDGDLSIADVTLLISYVLKNGVGSACPICADVNNDGFFTIADVTMLISKVLKKNI